ncbi:hypothetical protein Tco_0070441 [Tanacetum coccineum]
MKASGNLHRQRLFYEELARMRSEDVERLWVYRCKQFFKIDGVPEKMKVELASMHVYDKALVWHQQFSKKFGDNVPWDMYEQEARKRFGTMFEYPMVELKILKQDGNVQQYHV